MGRRFFGIQVRLSDFLFFFFFFLIEPFFMKTWEMGSDARSCRIHTWGMGKYVDIPRWSSCLHWLSFRSSRVYASSLFQIVQDLIPVFFFQNEGLVVHPHQGIWIWIGCTAWRYRQKVYRYSASRGSFWPSRRKPNAIALEADWSYRSYLTHLPFYTSLLLTVFSNVQSLIETKHHSAFD